MNSAPSLEEVLSRFDPITLGEMDGVKLQARMDTKYVFNERLLLPMLEELRGEYRLLEVNGVRGVSYRTLYFDTADRRHFLDHHNGRVLRSKVRFREYVGSDLCFLEVKRKTGRGGTDKVRVKVPAIVDRLTAEHEAFVDQASGVDEPHQAVLWNDFTRLTLVHRTRHERLTIDLGLRFKSAAGDRSLAGICIAELKEEKAGRGSPFTALMRDRGTRPAGMSKYCMGMILLELAPKQNAFKPTLLQLARLRDAA